MSKAYRDAFGSSIVDAQSLRDFLRPKFPRNPDGSVQYLTEQQWKDTCDVNKIIKKHDKTGLITHVSKFKADYGDLSGVNFTDMQNKLAHIKSKFEELPADIRKRFQNDPQQLGNFLADAKNKQSAVDMGLVQATPETPHHHTPEQK